jgi:hypothetical protein
MVLLSWSKLCNLFIAVLGLTIQLLICECYDPTKQFNPDDPTKQFNPAALLYLSHVKTHQELIG